MVTFEDLKVHAPNVKGSVFRICFDTNESALVKIVKRKFGLKITLQQAIELIAITDAACAAARK